MRLAHCSDLHLLSHDGVGLMKLANKRWLGAANLLSNRSRHYHVAAFDDMIADLNALGIEHVLCTGDVTNLALRQEFEFARAKFDQLAGGPGNVTVIPGNHDAYVAEGVGFFAEIFAPYATSDEGWAWSPSDPTAPPFGGASRARSRPLVLADRRDDLHWPIVRVRGELALIGLSTSRATPWFTAYGTVGEGQLARLRRVLADERLAGKARVVAIHHPAAGRRAESRIRGLRDHAAFAAVIAAAGADLIVHGHEHRNMAESLPGPAGPVPVRGVVSGTYFHDKPEKTARYRIYEVEGGKVRSDHLRVWDKEHHCFVADAPSLPDASIPPSVPRSGAANYGT